MRSVMQLAISNTPQVRLRLTHDVPSSCVEDIKEGFQQIHASISTSFLDILCHIYSGPGEGKEAQVLRQRRSVSDAILCESRC